MSRLIVKGLPKYYTEDNLREHFGLRGAVTDVKLMKKRNGELRRFAFIGYKSLQDAENAARFFNKSFIDTARIDVEVAKTFSDPTVPLSFREKRRLGDTRLREQEERLLAEQERQQKRQRSKHASLDDEIAQNPKLREFMEVMKPSHQVKSWANDVVADGSGGPSAADLEAALAEKDGQSTILKNAEQYKVAQAQENASDDEYDDFGGFKDDENDEDEEMVPLSTVAKDSENIQDDGLAVDEAVSDLDWLKMRRKRMKDGEVVSTEANTEEPPEIKETKDEAKKFIKPIQRVAEPEISEEEANAAKIAETGRLFIRNILYTSTEEEFRELFLPYGALLEVHIAVDTRTGKSKGFVYVQFVQNHDAVAAFQALDKQIFQGRLLHILPGQKKKDHRLDEFDLKNLPLKKQRDLKKKDQASKAQFSWNSLYMNSDAVLESVAAKMGVSKALLIDPQDTSGAVKQALAEAHVIGDVRKYFEEKGVDLTTFDQKERDDKVILVKNFPFGTTLEELGELFRPFGELKRTLMPPAGTIAIVEFRDSPAGRAAFTKLAYKRFKKSIIYLEKGPKDLFTREPETLELVASVEKLEDAAVEAKVTASDVLGGTPAEPEDAVDGPTVSVFVKNLNFSTTSQALTEAFKAFSGFAVATVKTKPDPKKEDGVLSMGFGFVEFKTRENANAAISAMDGHNLDGHKLQLKLSHRQGGVASKKTAAVSDKSSKIIIKNLPFEASRKDILELFGSFGQLKSVRVPRKFDKSARGFAFVEFMLLKEAENAMNQLEGVHLLGRRLVMQYAERDSQNAEEEIDRMTKKVRKQVATTQLAAARLSGKGKILLGDDEDEFDELV